MTPRLVAPTPRLSTGFRALPFADALWSSALDVWTDDARGEEVIANRLGWLDALTSSRRTSALKTFADSVHGSGAHRHRACSAWADRALRPKCSGA
jgi:hypothetical protein